MSKQKLYLGEAITTAGERGPFYLDGKHILAISGVIDGATLSFYHKLPASANPESLSAMTADTEMSFTAIPAPFEYNSAGGLPFYFNVATPGGTTSLNIAAFKID